MSRLARGSRLRLVFPFASIALWLASLFLTATLGSGYWIWLVSIVLTLPTDLTSAP
jgi:hypothetical protein